MYYICYTIRDISKIRFKWQRVFVRRYRKQFACVCYSCYFPIPVISAISRLPSVCHPVVIRGVTICCFFFFGGRFKNERAEEERFLISVSRIKFHLSPFVIDAWSVVYIATGRETIRLCRKLIQYRCAMPLDKMGASRRGERAKKAAHA